MEIKHGRLSMAAFLGVITTYSGLRWPGYLSTSMDLKFSDIPGGAISSWAALPAAAWFQIVLIISFCEVAFLKQDPAKAPGDVVPEGWAWARYPDGCASRHEPVACAALRCATHHAGPARCSSGRARACNFLFVRLHLAHALPTHALETFEARVGRAGEQDLTSLGPPLWLQVRDLPG